MAAKFDRRLIPKAPDLSFETALWDAGTRLVAGIDEAGRGALAGPVAAAVVILPIDPDLVQTLRGVRDSKQMTPSTREHWAARLRCLVVASSVGCASSGEIDSIGIVPATQLAVKRALESLEITPQHLLVDYIDLPGCSIPQTPLVKGDARCLSIAAASILAKTWRDDAMRQLDQQYAGYGFASHKGYGTWAHRKAIAQMGLSPIHRRSFKTSPASKKQKPPSG